MDVPEEFKDDDDISLLLLRVDDCVKAELLSGSVLDVVDFVENDPRDDPEL